MSKVSHGADHDLTGAISSSMVEPYATFYKHDRTTATTYMNENIVVCVLESILTEGEDTLIAEGEDTLIAEGEDTLIAEGEDTLIAEGEDTLIAEGEDTLIAEGAAGEVIDGRVGFQTETQDEFTAAIERLSHRHVSAFLSANQTTAGVACELLPRLHRQVSETRDGNR